MDDRLPFGLRIPADAKDLVRLRRARRSEYETLEVPSSWTGMPTPTVIDRNRADTDMVTGIGVSAGLVEGTARVVLDPDFTEVEPGEILVSPTTNPSWASVMFVSAGLVVDVGSVMSHAAVVARELGIPCVVDTHSGTAAIRSGDRIRVDGTRGTVEILDRVAAG